MPTRWRTALKFMEMGQPAFLSIHLQDTGEGGVPDDERSRGTSPGKTTSGIRSPRIV